MKKYELRKLIREEIEKSQMKGPFRDSEIIKILKSSVSSDSLFYQSNFSDYLIDIKHVEYDGVPQDKLITSQDVIDDFKKWAGIGMVPLDD
jgi:hypothetical protein